MQENSGVNTDGLVNHLIERRNPKKQRQIPANSLNKKEIVERRVESSEQLRKTKFLRLAMLLIYQEVNQGHLKWKVTALSRMSQMSRSRIYEVFGDGKKRMLLCAVKMILDEICGNEESKQNKFKTGFAVDSILKIRKFLADTPELLAFYFCNRQRNDEVGVMIREYEKKAPEMLLQGTDSENEPNQTLLHFALCGIAVNPILSELDARRCLQSLLGL